MSRIKSSGTKPEMVLKNCLHKAGFHYRTGKKVFGKPDLILPEYKIAVFVHGCFWHMHGCKNSVIPKTNLIFWRNKLTDNVLRDKKVARILKNKGWYVKVVWECQLERNLESTIRKLVNYISNMII